MRFVPFFLVALASAASADVVDVKELVKRLGDDNFVVRDNAENELANRGSEALPLLREAVQGRDPEVSVRARRLIGAVSWTEVKKRFERIGKQTDGEVDFETAVFDIARIEQPELDDAPWRRKLDELAARVKAARGEDNTPADNVFALLHVLEKQEKFTGQGLDQGDNTYNIPENSFLHSTLKRKKGLPIMLSTVYVLVGKRCGMPVVGVGAPGHYICKYADADPKNEIFIDPFHNKFFTLEQVKESGLGGEERTAATGSKATLKRMVQNVLNAYNAAGDDLRVSRLEEIKTLLGK